MSTPTNDQLSALIEATRRHRDEGILIHGPYEGTWKDGTFHGGSVACLAYDISRHAPESNARSKIVADFYGNPQWLVFLQDALFRPADENIHVRLAEAIKPRNNWTPVRHAIHRRILTEITLPYAGRSADAVQTVIELHKREVSAESVEWTAARSAAVDAANDAEDAVAIESDRSVKRAYARLAVWTASLAAGSAGLAAGLAPGSAAGLVGTQDLASQSAGLSGWSIGTTMSTLPTGTEAWKTITTIVLEEVAR